MSFRILFLIIIPIIIFVSYLNAQIVNINENNITLIDGKPFFPLGLYIGNSPTEILAMQELDEISDSPFNTILNYEINAGSIDQIRKYLDVVNKKGLKIIYSIKDFYEGTKYYPKKIDRYKGEEEITRGIIKEFRDHPAILAWYHNDELPEKYIPRLKGRYKLIKDLDKNHPTFSVIFQINNAKSYIDTTDIIGIDPYPIPNKPISLVSEWVRSINDGNISKKPIWIVLQAHNIGIYSKDKHRSPTYEEMKCMAYQAIVNGVKGIMFYSYFDLKRDPSGFDSRWSDVKRLGEEIKSLIPIILSTEKTPKVQILSGSKSIHFTTKYHNKNIYIIAVNVSDKPISAEFVIPSESKNAIVLYEDRTLDIEKYTLKDYFPPVAVKIYEIKVD